jgi:hypothetical protein
MLVAAATAFAGVAAGAYFHPTHRAADGKLTGLTRVALDKKAPADSLVLQSFSFRFQNGDHKVRAIQATPGTTDAEVFFADVDANDPYSVDVRWLSINGGRRFGTVKWGCVGTCVLPLEKPNPGEALALTSFNLRLNPPRDANLRQIAIRPKPDKGIVEVVFRDNGGTNPYDARIGYVYLPASLVAHQQSLTKRAKENVLVDFKKPIYRSPDGYDYQGVLQGFDISYVNGDHYLRDFSIAGLANGNTLQVMFNDKNWDDPVDATVDYVLLKP